MGSSITLGVLPLGTLNHFAKDLHIPEDSGFEFLGDKIKRGQKMLHLPASKIRSQARQGALYAYPKEKSIGCFMDQVRQRTKRGTPLKTPELIVALNPLLRAGASITNALTSESCSNVSTAGSGDASGRIGTGVGGNAGWKRLPVTKLYGEYELVRLIDLIPSLASRRRWVFVKAAYTKCVRAVWEADGGWLRERAEYLPAKRQQSGASPVGKEAEVADANETFRK
jgi:hypothetical protein